jgi:hypothetical protein
LSGYPREPQAPEYTWASLVYPSDAEITSSAWSTLQEGRSTTFSFRWKWQKADKDLTEEQMVLGGQWVTASCLPLLDADGNVESITGCMLDMTAQKLSTINLDRALEQARAAEEERAAEAISSALRKERLENFDTLFALSDCALFEVC